MCAVIFVRGAWSEHIHTNLPFVKVWNSYTFKMLTCCKMTFAQPFLPKAFLTVYIVLLDVLLRSAFFSLLLSMNRCNFVNWISQQLLYQSSWNFGIQNIKICGKNHILVHFPKLSPLKGTFHQKKNKWAI